MKKLITLTITLVLATITFAQVPNSFSYRSIAIDSENRTLNSEKLFVEVHILDELDKNATILYNEIHTVTTNSAGAFQLQIGNGNPQTEFEGLEDVEWTEGERFVRVIVRNLNNDIISDGLTQLMSVPYALFAKEVINDPSRAATIDCYDTLDDLRQSTTTPSQGDVVCIKGHSSFRDGGEGYFYFVSSLDLDDYDGIIVQPGEGDSPGRWVRHLDGFININYYGVRGGNQTNITDKIQDAIDFAAQNNQFDHIPPPNGDPENSIFTKGNTIFFPMASIE